jgi:hypothetical protein
MAMEINRMNLGVFAIFGLEYSPWYVRQFNLIYDLYQDMA